MSRFGLIAGIALVAVSVASAASAQQTQRLSGIVLRVAGNAVQVKTDAGEATVTIGSGAVPQADGTQKAVEVHIFAESQRGTGDGHRPGWPGAPNGTMTNGAAGNPVTSVDGLTVMVKYKDGEKKLLVTPSTPIVRYEVGTAASLKEGAAFSVPAATKKPDGTYETARINVGVDGVKPN
jgi:hypothetical protein